jgi:hypothetical protein
MPSQIVSMGRPQNQRLLTTWPDKPDLAGEATDVRPKRRPTGYSARKARRRQQRYGR